jgi:RNA polymerase sigma factor (sigma-70 family)
VTNPYLNISDRELMLKYQDGDHMAFDVLYSRHKNKVYSYLVKRLHDKDEVDDLYQKAFVKLHKSRHLYDQKYEFLPWLYTITRSEFLDFIRKNKKNHQEYNDQLHSPQEVPVDSFIDVDCENDLSNKEKQAINERYFNDKDFDEISEVLNTSATNVRKIISRGIKKLKDKYIGDNHE